MNRTRVLVWASVLAGIVIAPIGDVIGACVLPPDICTPGTPIYDKQELCCNNPNVVTCHEVTKQWFHCAEGYDQWNYAEETASGECNTSSKRCDWD